MTRSTHGPANAVAMLARVSSVAELVVRARAGERAAYELLYARFNAAVHATVLACVPFHDAADVVQDVFLSGWSHLGELREPAAFGGWILNAARRRAIDHKRSTRRRPAAAVEANDAELAQGPTPRAEALEAVQLIQGLPEAYRETLLMRLVEGMTGPEIADATGLTAESVRVNLCRGMKLLRERLEGGRP